jgi:hypothetical protein
LTSRQNPAVLGKPSSFTKPQSVSSQPLPVVSQPPSVGSLLDLQAITTPCSNQPPVFGDSIIYKVIFGEDDDSQDQEISP